MPRKILGYDGLADLFRHMMSNGIADLETKGLTEEEESGRMGKTFQEIFELGYTHIHTLKVTLQMGGSHISFI